MSRAYSTSVLTWPRCAARRWRSAAIAIEFAEIIAASLPPHLPHLEKFEGCGHVPCLDEQERAFKVLRDFIVN
jgi:hypothetical protein